LQNFCLVFKKIQAPKCGVEVNTPLNNTLLDLLTAVVRNFLLLAYLTEL